MYTRAKIAGNWQVWNKVWGDGEVSFSKAETGYHKFSNGFTLQWGRIPTVSSVAQHVYFPISFTTAYNIQVTNNNGIGNVVVDQLAPTRFAVMQNSAGNIDVYWFATGII